MAAIGTVGNMKFEPAWVLIGSAYDSLTNLGYCAEGDITVDIDQGLVPKTSSQTGRTPIDYVGAGQTITVSVNFSEVVNWDLWGEAFLLGEEQINTETPAETRYTSHKIADTGWVGNTLVGSAQLLCLRPALLYSDASTETARDFYVAQAVCTNVGTIPFGAETPQILPVEFTGLLDTAATDGFGLWSRGKTQGTYSAV